MAKAVPPACGRDAKISNTLVFAECRQPSVREDHAPRFRVHLDL
jgi:hypothetical protein